MKKIKEMINHFGILVIQTIWPKNKERTAQKVGLSIVALAALLGVTQARNVGQMLLGKSAAASQIQAGQAPNLAAPNQPVLNQTTPSVEDVAAEAPNIVDLIDDSETIIRGKVKEVTDGFANGIPYTQVTVEVDETLRGQVGAEYTFRQFGLTQPRRMENGKVYLGVTPDGWSRYEAGEDTMLFLHRPGSATGLQTTAGLAQGKVVFHGGNAVSQAGNEGLFENVEVNANLLNEKDKRLLATKRGAINAEGFKSFVKRAVSERWIEGGKMRHATK